MLGGCAAVCRNAQTDTQPFHAKGASARSPNHARSSGAEWCECARECAREWGGVVSTGRASEGHVYAGGGGCKGALQVLQGMGGNTSKEQTQTRTQGAEEESSRAPIACIGLKRCMGRVVVVWRCLGWVEEGCSVPRWWFDLLCDPEHRVSHFAFRCIFPTDLL